MPATSPKPTPIKRTAASRITNGSEVLAGVDGRSAMVRRYRDILGQLVDDMGGDPSEAQLQIGRRAAALSVWCEDKDAAAANGEPLDIATYTTASNALRRLLADLGLERRARNVTPTLAQYAAQRAVEKAHAA
jgi:hypothetical protein